MSTLTIDRAVQPYTNGQSAYKPFLHVQRDEPRLSTTKRSQILAELSDTLLEINQLYDNVEQRFSLIHHFTTVVNQRLWDAYADQPRYHQRLAGLLKMALRRTTPAEMALSQVGAFLDAVELLARPELTFADTIQCDKRFREAGMETLISLGQHRGSLVELYKQDDSE